ncbi:MAG TPA: zinc ABC transporter substrate-binding protein [Candidatus Limnocylindrales bacterium]|jgi:zinc/manganese transport system substrate-binding protein
MRRGLGTIIVAAALGASLVSCGGSTAPSSPTGSGTQLAVVGTENFYADLLAQIGPDVRVSSLLNDPNADPHAFETSPQAAALVADARLVIVNGIGYDDFMQQLLSASPDPTRIVINVQQLLGVADDVNAHVWYDPTTMQRVAVAATTALGQLEPPQAFNLSMNMRAYQAALLPLTAEITLLRNQFGGSPVAVTEPVAGYVTDAAGLRVLTPAGFQKAVEEGTDPAPVDVAAMEDLLNGRQVKVLIYNSQVTTPITQRMRDLAVADGIPVVGVSETMPPAYAHYAAWQLAQLQALQAALAQGS